MAVDLDLDSLEAFAVFSETLNFTHAAERLNISQPALHVKIKKLGRTLDVTLYQKRGRRLLLTEPGRDLARFARETGAQVSGFLREFQSRSRLPVSLAAGRGCYLYLLGDALRRFGETSQARLRLFTCDRTSTLEMVRSGEAQLGVTVLEALPSDMHTQRIHRAPGLLVVPRNHALARRRRLRVRDLEGLPLIAPPPELPHRVRLEQTLTDNEVSCQVVVEANGWELMLHFVSLGLGVAIVNGCCEIPKALKAIPIADYPYASYFLCKKRTLPLTQDQELLEDAILQEVNP